MSRRVRLIYEKRGGACFVPHIALADLFSRAARRAGIRLASTDGFSPHAKMSFGPELPAGVVALNEPVDLWLGGESEDAAELTRLFNEQMPDGFRVKGCSFVEDGAPSLGKDCREALYLIWARDDSPAAEALMEHIKNHFGADVLSAEIIDDDIHGVSVTLAAPAKNGIGGWVRALIASAVIAGWQDVCIVRGAVGPATVGLRPWESE